MAELHTGTTTFLFTDIESSTQLWEQYPNAMPLALKRHDQILAQAVAAHGGRIVKTTGDGILAVFELARQGAAAALEAQNSLCVETWNEMPAGTIRVRMGLHTGEAELRDGDYFGSALNRANRLMSAGHGGQILVSSSTSELLFDGLPAEGSLRDMGEHRLKDLPRPERLFQLVHPALPAEFPPLRIQDRVPHNLPVQLTSFIGRETEIEEIKHLLDTAHMVTLTGPGGTGKTRLSQEVSAQLLQTFPDGVWLVELAPLSDPSQIVPAMAQALGLQELPSHSLTTVTKDYLREKVILLILDNCEHLIEACASLANDLLRQCPRLKILASSRESMGIAGEITYRIPPLANLESTCLFVERAQAVNPKFQLTDDNAAAITQICRRLDGIPLAIELAGARIKLLSPEQLATRLDDRFRLLIGGSRTALPRQQTLRALIDWSYDLLSEEEKQLLNFASVFRGGWILEALEAVTDDVNTVELLEQLVNKSLVFTEEHEGVMRFFMLETIRQYASEKLFDAGQSVEIRDRHYSYYCSLSEEMWDTFRSKYVLGMVGRMNEEVENFYAALAWGSEYHVEENLRLAANFAAVYVLQGLLVEGLSIANNAVERARELPEVSGEAYQKRQRLIARALFTQGLAGLGAGNMSRVYEVLKEAIAISRETGDKQILGYSLSIYYTATRFVYAPDRGAAVEEAYYIFSHEIDDPFGLGLATLMMTRLSADRGNEEEKARYFDKVKEVTRAAPESYQVGMFHMAMGMDESARGNYETAKKFFEDSAKLFNKLGNKSYKLILRSEIGHIERHTGNLPLAKEIYYETIKGWQEVGNRSAIAHQLECFGFIAMAEGDINRAAVLFGAAEGLRERAESPMTNHERTEYESLVAQLRAMISDNEFNSLWSEGRAMTAKLAVEYVLMEA
jgi:predicted ATPase/class 3 adenylate cyclase